MSELPYRPNVCMLVYRGEKLLLAERARQPGTWQFPQGGAEEELSLEENVLKELNEELGAKKKLFRIEKKLDSTHCYDFREPPKYAVGRWRGQSQTFWLVEFLGQDSDIQLDRYEQELMDFRWCTPSEVRELAEPIRLPGYEAPLLEFEAFIS